MIVIDARSYIVSLSWLKRNGFELLTRGCKIPLFRNAGGNSKFKRQASSVKRQAFQHSVDN